MNMEKRKIIRNFIAWQIRKGLINELTIDYEMAETYLSETDSLEKILADVRHSFKVGDKVNYCNGLIFKIESINEKTQVCYDNKGMWYALVNCKQA